MPCRPAANRLQWACRLHATRTDQHGSGEAHMKSFVELLAPGGIALMLGMSLATGCGGTDADGAQVEQGLTTVDMVDCSICATAKACCNAVNPGSYCNNFDAARCEVLDPGRQRTTKLNCLVQLRTTISAWRLAGRTPPSECRIPGE